MASLQNQKLIDKINILENELSRTKHKLSEQIILNKKQLNIISSLEKQIINQFDHDSSFTTLFIAIIMSILIPMIFKII